ILFRIDDRDCGRLGAWRIAEARIRARSLHRQDSSLRINRDRARTVSVPDVHGILAAGVQFPNEAWLFLREQQATVGCSGDTVGVIGALPYELPLCAGRDDAWNLRNGYLPRTLLLRERDDTATKTNHNDG